LLTPLSPSSCNLLRLIVGSRHCRGLHLFSFLLFSFGWSALSCALWSPPRGNFFLLSVVARRCCRLHLFFFGYSPLVGRPSKALWSPSCANLFWLIAG
jgi:hypothetical protein